VRLGGIAARDVALALEAKVEELRWCEADARDRKCGATESVSQTPLVER
jgi:hypothetical protein